LAEHGGAVSPTDKAKIEADLKALKDVLDSGDAETIKAKTEALTQSSMKLGEALYKAQQEGAAAGDAAAGAAGAGASAGAGSSTGPNGETVVDADFEEVDPRKGR